MSTFSSAHLEAIAASDPTDLFSSNSSEESLCQQAYSLREFDPASDGSAVQIDGPSMALMLSQSTAAMDSFACGSKFAMPIGSGAASSDPVLRRLYDQLERAENWDDDDGAYADAFRLAIVARWLRLRSHEQRAAEGLQRWRLRRVLAYIDEHIGQAIYLDDLAKAANLSRMYFASRFRAATGLRPNDYILRRRIERAKELLAKGDASLVEVALDVGFQTQAHFTTVFKRFVGTTPGRWRSSSEQLG